MIKEVLSGLKLKAGDTVLDATVGAGGHSREIIKQIMPGGMLIGLDADDFALETSIKTLAEFSGSFKLIRENFRNLDMVLSKEGVKSINAVLFDIGISSLQIDDGSRGFSMRTDGRLDMRMDRRLSMSAYDIVNRVKERELSEMIEKYGEERLHRIVARRIAEARAVKSIETTRELVAIIHDAIGPRYRKSKIDPATRTFQAIRIAVNDELSALEDGLKKAISWLSPGARICVISFHSLEDRIVKNIFRGYAKLGVLRVVTKKPLRPSPEEVAGNSRARSSRLRIAERV